MSLISGTIASAYQQGKLTEFFQPFEFQPRTDIDRIALVEALHAYYDDLEIKPPESLNLLKHPYSSVVVTGQQAGLLTGPAYSVHKGVDAILLARQLNREEAPVLPVYWIASQDHDTAEVAATTFLDMQETLHHLKLSLPQGVPVGRIPWQWTDEVLELLEQFAAPHQHKEKVRSLWTSAMKAGTYADVFARLIHGLLGANASRPDGLILLDPLHPALAKLMVPTLLDELQRPLLSSKYIEEAAERLLALGLTPQLRRPSFATNLFIETDSGRHLLRYAGEDFFTEHDAATYSIEDLKTLLQQDSTRITPAAGLRPIVQDKLLPTRAFVVGNGEIAYGAQLRRVYESHGIRQPLIWPRLSVTWLEPNVSRILDRFELTAQQLQANPEEILGYALAREQNAALLTQDTLSSLEEQFAALMDSFSQLDPTLQRSVERTRIQTLARFQRFREKAAQSLARTEDIRTGQLTRLQKHLLPLGHPQEREMNFFTYLLKHGDEPLRQLFAQPAGFVGELRIS